MVAFNLKAVTFGLAASLLQTGLANEYLKQRVMQSRVDGYEKGVYKKDLSTRAKSVLQQPAQCVEGVADIGGENFPCDNVDFYSFISSEDLFIPGPPAPGDSADIWGWLSPSGREITILTLDHGVVLVDSTEPENPCILAKMRSKRPTAPWSDVKVHDNTMYFVKDSNVPETPESQTVGVEVWDLLPFDGIDCQAPGFEPISREPDFIVPNHARSHNVLVNTETARMYTCGATVCSGGLVAFDISNRLQPEFIRCVDADGYTHDAQCVIYTGPDTRYQGREICLAFNEDTLTIWDVTDLETEEATLVSRTLYFNQAYSHQGWFNREMTKVLLDDELDELCNSANPPSFCSFLVAGELSGVLTTSTNIFDVTDLENPILESQYIHPDLSIDHNLYIWGTIHERGWGGNGPLEFFPDPRFAYLNNYMAGLRVLDIRNNNSSEWFEVGFFDISPEQTDIEFLGAWSGYMHPSGVYAISSIERGLFFLQPGMVFSDDFPAPQDEPTASPVPDGTAPPDPTPSPVPDPTSSPVPDSTPAPVPDGTAPPTEPTSPGGGGDVDAELIFIILIVLIVICIVLIFTILFFLLGSRRRTQQFEVGKVDAYDV